MYIIYYYVDRRERERLDNVLYHIYTKNIDQESDRRLLRSRLRPNRTKCNSNYIQNNTPK